MCLAIYKPATTKPDWEAYANGHRGNNDSWGFAAVVDGAIVTRCGIGPFAEFEREFEPYSDRQAIIHFRWATHGKKDTANCHPFMVADDLAVIHNGVIGIKCDVNADMSDTWHFVELVLKPMHGRDPDFYRHSDMVYTQEMAHGGSKFAFLRADGDYEIWNAESGKWEEDGHWYSNTSYELSYCRSWYTQKDTSATTKEPVIGGFAESARTDWYRKSDDDDVKRLSECVLADPYLQDQCDEDEDDGYTAIRLDDLRQYGVSNECLSEILNLFGPNGIEALHDEM
jgi:glutamine amidotransferase